ncbi:hypothetical protein [Lachnoclostridium phytofermentans]|uniref:hypothetical protein n=1 Tax=Lachnoclostridium phytofermentans TaxID=66219 RepID=UPI0002EBBFFB|nr:hypothetical protein [Lachnoclostridium phytofermentans]
MKYELWLWLLAPSALLVTMVFKALSWNNLVMHILVTIAITIIVGLQLFFRIMNTAKVTTKVK